MCINLLIYIHKTPFRMHFIFLILSLENRIKPRLLRLRKHYPDTLGVQISCKKNSFSWDNMESQIESQERDVLTQVSTYMYIYIYTCVHIYIYIYIYMCAYVYIHMCKYVHTYIYINIRIYIYVYICVCVCIYMHI